MHFGALMLRRFFPMLGNLMTGDATADGPASRRSRVLSRLCRACRRDGDAPLSIVRQRRSSVVPVLRDVWVPHG